MAATPGSRRTRQRPPRRPSAPRAPPGRRPRCGVPGATAAASRTACTASCSSGSWDRARPRSGGLCDSTAALPPCAPSAVDEPSLGARAAPGNWRLTDPTGAEPARSLGPVTTAPALTVALDDGFARAVPELAVPWQAEPAPEPGPARAQRAAGRRARPGRRRAPERRRARAAHRHRGAAPVRTRWRRRTPGTSSAASTRGSATVARCCSASSSTGTAGVRDLHLKGSGRTPFARGGDGLAAVGPMLREYVVSEAMHALGIPTTRALAVVATGRGVRRETVLPGAVLARVASSHLRVGSFQYAAAPGRRRPDAPARRPRDRAALPGRGRGGRRRTSRSSTRWSPRRRELVAQWMLVGFVHGVMNTDNVTISGRDDRLRPVRLHGGLRPGDRLQLDRRGRALRLRQPARHHPVEPGPARRGAAAAPQRRPGPGGGARDRLARRVRRAVRRRLVGRDAGEARAARRRGRGGRDAAGRGPARR